MAETFNFNFFQVAHSGVDSATKGVAVQTRDLDMKMSSFGAMNTGARMSSDYTRTSLDFKSKDELENPTLPSFWLDADSIDNPLVLGSTVKYTRDDQFVRMGMSKSDGVGVDQPGFDVMDKKETTPGGTNAMIKNWPTEGYRSFGGKYDFQTAYAGGTLK